MGGGRKKEKMVLEFRLDKGNHTPFINRQSVKALRECSAGFHYGQHFKRKENVSILVKEKKKKTINQSGVLKN